MLKGNVKSTILMVVMLYLQYSIGFIAFFIDLCSGKYHWLASDLICGILVLVVMAVFFEMDVDR